MTPQNNHDALPWYVNGTLGAEESKAFERHLMDCADCRKELEFLEQLRAELAAHGDEFLSDHPSPEKLLSLTRPGEIESPLDETEIAGLRRHLALCVTCAEEARWLLGEATAGPANPDEDRDGSPERMWRWAAVAAMLLAAVTTSAWLLDKPTTVEPGLFRPVLVEETVRANGDPVEIAVQPDAALVFLVLPLDFPVEAFPLDLEIVDRAGNARHRDSIDADQLMNGLYLYLGLTRSKLVEGDYRAVVSASQEAAGKPAAEFPFRIVAGTP